MNCLLASARGWMARRIACGGACEKGASTVEFALIAPVFIILIAGVADIGGLLISRSDVSTAVTAGSTFLIVNAERVASAPEEVARQTAAVAGDRLPVGGVARVTVNDGLTVEYANGGFSSSGNASSANLCFCPQGRGASLSLGSPLECGSPCSSGGYAGRYIQVMASHGYRPLFGGFGIVSPDGNITVNSVVGVL